MPVVVWFPLIFVAGLFVVHAMVEFTSALASRHNPVRRKPVIAAELLDRMRVLEDGEKAFHLSAGGRGDRELVWNAWAPGGEAGRGRVRVVPRYSAWLLLDEERHELRWYEHIRSGGFFLGFDGWRPRFQFPLFFSAPARIAQWVGTAYRLAPGFPPFIEERIRFRIDVGRARSGIERLAHDAGWSVRPVYLWFLAQRLPFRLFRSLVPSPLRRISSRRFWGVVYPLSFLTVVAAILTAIGSDALSRKAWIPITIVTIGWWGTWGLLAWVYVRVTASTASARRRNSGSG